MSRLSWNQIRANAARFADEWKDAHYERGETQSFYNEFFQVFGVRRRKVASFEHPVKDLAEGKRGFLDLFWKGVLLVEQKSAGRKLEPAKTQAFNYFPGLKDSELPRYLLLSDFQTFELHDLELGTHVSFPLADLPAQVEHFGFILGIEKRVFRDQDPANIEASELMGNLHDALEASGYTGHDLERLLVRLLFCLFADDTGIFEPRDIFTDLIDQRTSEDGADVGQWLALLFDVLNQPEENRQSNLDEDLKAFPYINGDLFAERLRVPAFTEVMRRQLLAACRFNWSKISPAIFGALFQSVMDKKERRSQGAHYTTEKNILKVIEPLFLDELQAEFKTLKARGARNRRAGLLTFQNKLASLKFFDPACGCGNFLIIAYRELREMELQVLIELTRDQDENQMWLVQTNVDQFYGIEIGEFPARIAEVAMWMTDHIANNKISLHFGEVFLRIPLKTSPRIYHADALELDWNAVLPAKECDYVFGNPPFIGAKYQSELQREQVRRLANLGNSGGTLDFVSSWFIKAGEYARDGKARIGFVATNSITQGEQVAQLWPILFNRCALEITYGHRTFAWGSDARGMAHVHVVVLGLARRKDEPKVKRLFTYPDIKTDPVETTHEKLSPYLIDAANLSDPHVVVREESRPLNGLPNLITGSQPIDGGFLIFTPEEQQAFVNAEPLSASYFRPYIGSKEFINGTTRQILALQDASPAELRRMPKVLELLEKVKQSRLESIRPQTNAIANSPTQFFITVIPDRPFLILPENSSGQRDYAPIMYTEPPVIPSNKIRLIPDARLWLFGLLTSRMHMAWLQTIGGRIKSDYCYSIGVVYNPFPVPNITEAQNKRLDILAQKVLDARAQFSESTLADLYAPTAMPPLLRKAHQTLDLAVDKLYDPKPFTDNRHRAEHLLGRYEAMQSPLMVVVESSRINSRKR